MTIYLGTDHGGFELKEYLKLWLKDQGYTVEDCGATIFEAQDDYPDFAQIVAQKVAAEPNSKGILLCRSGGGMIIAANRYKGVRAVQVRDVAETKHACEDDHANVISLAADVITPQEAVQIVTAFLTTPYSSEERHVRRVKKLDIL